jgi:hypothetical protein
MFKLVLRRQAHYLTGSSAARIFPNASWQHLSPSFFLTEDEQGDSHCLELMSICRGDEPGLTKDHGHAWIRLIEPSGAVYSVGFYPDESTNVEPDEVPGLRMPGMLLSPDKYEKHHQKGWNCRSVRYPISEACFNKAKSSIETLQMDRLQGSLAFDLCEYNCVNFVINIAAICGVTIRANTSLSQLADDIYLSGKLQSISAFLSNRLPRSLAITIKHAVRNFRSLFFNLALALLGGFSILPVQWGKSSEGDILHLQVEKLEPVFSSCKQILCKRVPFYHVREFRKWQLEVNQKRQLK